MTPLTAFFGPGLAWLVVTVISSVVHALIFGVVFKVLRYLTLWEALLLLAVVLGGLAYWVNARGRRLW